MARKNNLSVSPSPDWQRESDHRTMTDAEDIKADSSRMAGVRKFHRQKMSTMKRMSRSVGMKK